MSGKCKERRGWRYGDGSLDGEAGLGSMLALGAEFALELARTRKEDGEEVNSAGSLLVRQKSRLVC